MKIQVGDRFGMLVTLGKDPTAKWTSWLVLCDCGGMSSVRSQKLTSGHTRSCGCLIRERSRERMTKHGMVTLPEYGVWQGMIQRCTNPARESYKDYGGRGIGVCAAWRNSFELFYTDMGSRPSSVHTLERIDNDRGYEPGNVRWATRSEQSRNKRNNVFVNGVIAADVADAIGKSRFTVYDRVRRGAAAVDYAGSLKVRGPGGRFS